MTHHDHHQTPVDDLAAARIRESLPPLDDAARERIAAHVAAGEQARTRRAEPTPARRRPSSRRLLRPALVAGAAALAVGIALLAPGDDASSPTNGLLGLGPDPAAADVLRAAGDATAQEPWRPLRNGEYHHVTIHHDEPYAVGARTEERWITADGTGYERETVDLATFADGAAFYTPAQTCDAQAVAAGDPAPGTGTTIPVGAPAPSCWSDGSHFVDPALHAAAGTAVAAPPAGAPVYLSPMQVAGNVVRTLRYGDDVREGDEPSATPPGHMGAITVPGSTTWVRVEPTTVVTQEGPTTPGGLAIDLLDWSDAITMDELANLPTDGDAMRAFLIDVANREAQEFARFAPSPEKIPAPTDERSLETSSILLAASLLATAPMSPEARQATFEALAGARFEDQRATVERDVQLPDGRPAIGVRFALVTPASTQDNADDHVLYVLDGASGRLVRMDVRIGGQGSTTSWDEPDRVDALPTPTHGAASLPSDADRIR